MATKKELKARIEELEAEVARLKSQPLVTWTPPNWPIDRYPFGWPKISYGSGSMTAGGAGQFTINASAA